MAGKFLYKYNGHGYLDSMFSNEDKVTLKYSYPKDFNDPYELFLTTTSDLEPELLACYAEAIGELPQRPTTCFSKSPIVVPMWAHYAQNHSGFVLEFSEDAIKTSIPECAFGDIDYSDVPIHDFSEILARVYHIGKPRYTFMLHQAVLSAAYYTKLNCWSYEQERRMIVGDQDTRQIGSLILGDLPINCITRIIYGYRCSDQTKSDLEALAERIGCDCLELVIGKTTSIPFLKDKDGNVYIFQNDELVKSDFFCSECKEPTNEDIDTCSWCSLDDGLRNYVATRNPYRILNHLGLLESYVREMDKIGKGR